MKAAQYLVDWTARAKALVESKGLTLDAITDPGAPWAIAYRTGFWREANDAGLSDGVVQTALERIFPNVRFNDPKRY